MPRTSRRAAIQSSAGKRANGPRRRSRRKKNVGISEPASASSKSSISSNSSVTTSTSPVEPKTSMADRYLEMAESMNIRGAMEMAVPFYRQAVTLLLAERENLQAELGGAESKPISGDLPIEELQGLLQAAESLGHECSTEEPSMEERIDELASELNQASALQVMAGLRVLAESSEKPMPATGMALLAKAQMLLGKPDDALESFEAALAASPNSRDFQINTGAARLANGDVNGALTMLRDVYNAGFEALEPATSSALLRNLSAATEKAGNKSEALQLRLQWFQQCPDALPVKSWLKWADSGLMGTKKGEACRESALAILRGLQQALPQERLLLQRLADALEDQGDYRDASLLYRELLRPQQTSKSQNQ